MDYNKFKEIMEDDDISGIDISSVDDNVIAGIDVIRKYIKSGEIIVAAGHDIIYSVTVDEIIEAGIIEEDVTKLSKLNWMVEYDQLACFV